MTKTNKLKMRGLVSHPDEVEVALAKDLLEAIRRAYNKRQRLKNERKME